MGCNTSKLERLPAVALCRERCKFMAEALTQSYVLADAHVAHIESLNTLSSSLSSFLYLFQLSPPINHINCSHSSSFSSVSLHHSHMHMHSHSELQQHHNNNNSSNSNSNGDKDFEITSSPPNQGGYYASKSSSSPPPPSPSVSAWDYFNLFESFHISYEMQYNPTHDSYCDEATEEKDKRMVASKEEDQKVEEVDSNEKKFLSENEVPELDKCSSSSFNSVKFESKKGLCEAVEEIQILFQKASDSGKPIFEMLDVGKQCYHSKFAFKQVSCKVKHVLTPAISSLVRRRMGIECEVVDRDNGHSCENLCFTLKKLCMWEKKLYHEVKAEEKLRILHQKKCLQLKRMNKKGADAQKVESVQTLIGILAVKMKISIQVVDKISITISKLREEELWPQINKFIHMFLKMWEDMQECYRCQYKEIAELKALDASAFDRNFSNGQIDAAIKLKSELQNWNLSFSDWIHAQMSQVKALNGWLVRCLMYEPDDSTPFSPGKIGAPPVFVICNKWSRLVDNISEKNVMEAVNRFMLRINDLLEKHILDLQQKLTLDKELERKVKILERHEHKMNKVVQARERKMVPVVREESETLLQGCDVLHHHGDFVDNNNMQSDLKQIFSAMERFTASNAHLFQELCQQIKSQGHVLGDSNKIY